MDSLDELIVLSEHLFRELPVLFVCDCLLQLYIDQVVPQTLGQRVRVVKLNTPENRRDVGNLE